jgi:hypothetical protein
MIIADMLQNTGKRIFCGVVFLVAGVMVGYLSDKSASIITSVCGPSEPLWCIPLRVALYDLGLRSISYTLIVLGIVIAVLYNYIAELVSAILSFALNHIANSSKVVIDAMDKNRLTRSESKSIIVEATSRYMGYFDENSWSVGDFFASKILDQTEKDGGFWRKDYHSIINVEKLNSDEYEQMADAYLRWNETLTFTIANVKPGKSYPYSSASSVEIINSTDVADIIKNYKYDIKVAGTKIFSFDDYRGRILQHDFTASDEFNDDGLSVAVRGGDFHFSFQKTVTVEGTVADIVVDEESFISIEDRIFQLAFNEPTKRVTFRFNLPHDLEVYHCGVTGRKFGTSASSLVNYTQPSPNRVRIDSGDWILPGLVTILAWKSKPASTPAGP